MKDDTLSTGELLRDISSMSWALNSLLGKGKRYEELLKYILDKNWMNDPDENITIPSVKDLVKETGLKYDKLKKYLVEIFTDIRESQDIFFDFNSLEYTFIATAFGKTVYFTSKSLPVIPRVGETINLHYFRSYLKTSLFHVS